MPPISSTGDGGGADGSSGGDSDGGGAGNGMEEDQFNNFKVLSDGRLFLSRSNVYLNSNHYCLEQCVPSQRIIAIICLPEQENMESCIPREAIYTAAMCATILSLGGIYLNQYFHLYVLYAVS